LDLDEDLLFGAKEIAAYLGTSERRIYYLVERRSGAPIRKRPGIGMYALKSELRAWLVAPETLAARPPGD